MNIQAEKLELVRMILDTDNPGIISAIKMIFKNSGKSDFWEKLPQSSKDEIMEGISDVENGKTVSYQEVMKKHRK
jgi:hypothetical protein